MDELRRRARRRARGVSAVDERHARAGPRGGPCRRGSRAPPPITSRSNGSVASRSSRSARVGVAVRRPAAGARSCPAARPLDGPQPVGVLRLAPRRVPRRLDDLDRAAQVAERVRPVPEARGEAGRERRAANRRLGVRGPLDRPPEHVREGLDEDAVRGRSPVDPERRDLDPGALLCRIDDRAGLEGEALERRADDVGARSSGASARGSRLAPTDPTRVRRAPGTRARTGPRRSRRPTPRPPRTRRRRSRSAELVGEPADRPPGHGHRAFDAVDGGAVGRLVGRAREEARPAARACRCRC